MTNNWPLGVTSWRNVPTVSHYPISDDGVRLCTRGIVTHSGQFIHEYLGGLTEEQQRVMRKDVQELFPVKTKYLYRYVRGAVKSSSSNISGTICKHCFWNDLDLLVSDFAPDNRYNC